MNGYYKMGGVSDLDDSHMVRARGVGSKSLDDDDIRYLLKLRFVQPGRSLRSYKNHLERKRG
eukprot:CAMPEP_0198153414 /NCGR_PEP_ID=MMETSP1443-20131203/64012_1 /TAXON_ID=186043 /ORGANISM="Entomoneis sp., Strain CCMP2396" /LENGTH=61 /DNA_ID=CAMNT_0043819743 /DNA_START=87 /DNA_END=272 /DNA_ORIENTATION=-